MATILDRKLLRDLWRLKGQVVSIALVIASGVALLVMSLSTHEALRDISEAYYERYRFGHVFAAVERAPLRLGSEIQTIPGVQSVQMRISMQAVLDVAGFPEPLMGRLVSIPEGEQPRINRLVLRSGRLVERGRPDEVLVNASFADAHGLRPGDTIEAILDNGKRRLRIVGTAMSPEFIYVISPFALIPDKKRYGILWMGREALEGAYDYDGAFNDLSLTVLRGADTRPILRALDHLLAPYGGIGAIDRADHLSAWFVQNELEQNRTTARILPVIFLLVAAFLTNTVLTRLVATERSEIGLLKAFGYSNGQVGWHYVKLVLAIAALGVVAGWILGAELGRLNTRNYVELLNFPFLIYRPGPSAFVIGAMVSFSVALLATARAVRGAAKLPPVVAMRPPAPPAFERAQRAKKAAAWLDEPTRIMFRQIARWPRRAAVTVAGLAGAVGMMVLSLQFTDAIEEIARSHFDELQRYDLLLGFRHPRPAAVRNEISRLPGVVSTEPMRIVPADLVAGHLQHRGAIQGVPTGAHLSQVFDVRRGRVEMPPEGVVLADKLAEKLQVSTGSVLRLQILEGRRPERRVVVVDTIDSYIGMFAYMNLATLNTLLGDPPVMESAAVLIDETREAELLAELKELPAVSSVALKAVALANFHDTIAGTLMIFIGFFSTFSFALGFGVTYNAARIALSERGRELATLRVLGFSRAETVYVLFGETVLLVCLALPLGCLAGWALTAVFVHASGFQTELFRLPFVIRPATYGMAVVVLLMAGAASGFAVRRWVRRLDLIAVLKTRE